MKRKQEKFAGEEKFCNIALIAFYALLAYVWLYIFIPKLIPYFLRIGIPSKPVNILVIGSDVVYSGRRATDSDKGRSDTLMLINFNPFTSKINLLSIPRDTMAKIPGYGFQKINAAQSLGGDNLAVETVEKFLGVRIDRYITITPSKFIGFIDAIGGVKVYVNKDMYYYDRAANLNINLKEGWKKLSGTDTQGFIRFRHESLGDIARVQHQQELFKALGSQLANPFIIFRLPWLVANIASWNTNLNPFDIAAIANMIRMTGKGNMQMMLLPGDFSEHYWVADREKTKFIVEKYFVWPAKRGEEKYTPNIAIINNSGKEENVDNVLKKLRDKDSDYFLISVQATDREDFLKTRVIAQKGDEYGAKKLSKEIGIKKVEVSSQGDIRSDFTIILGSDYR